MHCQIRPHMLCNRLELNCNEYAPILRISIRNNYPLPQWQDPSRKHLLL